MPAVLETLAAVREVESGSWTHEIPGGLTGFSGKKLINLLQRLAQQCDPSASYAEVGVFQGLTLLSVATANPTLACFGIDDFSLGDGAANQRLVEERRAALGLHNAALVSRDYEDALPGFMDHSGGRRISLYMVDGPHDYRSQLTCLLLALGALADDAVIVVDDCNYAHVRLANRDFLMANPDFALAFEAYTPSHPHRASAQDLAAARAGWWNGINVMVRDCGRLLERCYPPVPAQAIAFQQAGHALHAMPIMPAAAEILQAADALFAPRPRRIPGSLRALVRKMRHVRLRHAPSTVHTDSDGLTAASFAALSDLSAMP